MGSNGGDKNRTTKEAWGGRWVPKQGRDVMCVMKNNTIVQYTYYIS